MVSFLSLLTASHAHPDPKRVMPACLNAVATAGGFTYRANERRVFIRHANGGDEIEFPLLPSTPVLPGDTIRIGERLF